MRSAKPLGGAVVSGLESSGGFAAMQRPIAMMSATAASIPDMFVRRSDEKDPV